MSHTAREKIRDTLNRRIALHQHQRATTDSKATRASATSRIDELLSLYADLLGVPETPPASPFAD